VIPNVIFDCFSKGSPLPKAMATPCLLRCRVSKKDGDPVILL
jgi:hypothetical protein